MVHREPGTLHLSNGDCLPFFASTSGIGQSSLGAFTPLLVFCLTIFPLLPQEMVEDEDDDFLKGEVGITPNSFDAHFRSPSSSVGSPPAWYLPDQSPRIARVCD